MRDPAWRDYAKLMSYWDWLHWHIEARLRRRAHRVRAYQRYWRLSLL
jgi:hypothetical protein